MMDSEDLASPKQYGVTKPVSLAGPSEADLLRTKKLNKFLVDAGLYESEEGSAKREKVLTQIKQIVIGWVKELTRLRGYTDQMVEDANAVLFTCGSYWLRVHDPGADIDALCVGPSYMNRDDFFCDFHDILIKMDEVTEFLSIPDAYVPVMKFKFDGISIDLVYASVSLLVVPDDLDISDTSVFYNVDEKTVRSLHGCRVADQILKHVPNIEHFRTTLHCIRFWAKRRGVYSNEIEHDEAQWAMLFEPYMFFKSYKNYLQVDIIARDPDDLRAWKAWVNSRLRQLTLMIERDTQGMLQCQFYPHEYIDPLKHCPHTAIFMGLERKQSQSQPIQEGQQFDIRGTVDEFRHTVNMYILWRPGMEIYVSHVRRKKIPLYVLPNGVKPARIPRPVIKNPEKSRERHVLGGSVSAEMVSRVRMMEISPVREQPGAEIGCGSGSNEEVGPGSVSPA